MNFNTLIIIQWKIQLQTKFVFLYQALENFMFVRVTSVGGNLMLNQV